MLCYRGGQGKGGNEQLQEVARYPNEIVQSSTHHYCGQTYPSLILPFNRIHVKLGGCSTRPGKLINVEQLQHEISATIKAFISSLESVAQQLCACLLRTPRDFGATELKISESKEAVDINHSDAAFLIVSCTDEKPSNSQPQR